jgi:hypothetical protein
MQNFIIVSFDGTDMSSSLLLPVFPPVQYLSLLEEEVKTTTHPSHNDDEGDESSNNKNNYTNVRRVPVSNNHYHDRVDGVLLTILPPPQSSSSPPHRHHHHQYRILLQRKLRHHTGTGGDTHVGFVVQESGDNDGRAVTTADREVQMVHVRIESSAEDSHLAVRGERGDAATNAERGVVRADDENDDKNGAFSSSSLSLWETTIDPGFRALQWLTDQLLLVPSRMSPSRDSDDFATPYRLDLSAHLLLAKNEFHAVCVTPRRSNAISLADFVTLLTSRDHDEVAWTEDSARCLFRDILTVR